MKKIILSIAISLFGFVCTAAVVSENQAAEYARKFFRTGNPVKLVVNSENIAGSTGVEAPAYYVFDNPAGGWVMISGEDTSFPVLAYSRTGSFEAKGLPENVKYFLNGLRKDVKTLRSYNIQRHPKIVKAWNTVGEVDKNAPRKASKTLETAQWNQSAPYNKFVPVSGAPAGCVATAMSIIMRYYKWPEKPTGTTDAYAWESTKIPARKLDGKTYDWAKMPLTDAIKGNWDAAAIDKVAELMYDCGCTVHMQYSSSGSGAFSEDVTQALSKYMKYSKSATLQKRAVHTTEEWLDRIAGELSSNRPVYYSGSGSGGHAFVCDGVNTDANDAKYLRINWGWGGSDNGWYTLDLYISSAYQFGEGQDAIFGLYPDPNGTSQDAKAELVFIPYGNKNGFNLASGKIRKGERFHLEAFYLSNTNAASVFEGYATAVLADKNGAVKETPAETKPFSLDSGHLAGLDEDKTINTDISITDKLIVVSKLKNEGSQWAPVRYDVITPGFLPTLGVTDARIILYDENVKAGDKLPLLLSPGQAGTKSVSWTFNGAAAKNSITLVSGKNEIVARIQYADDSTEEVHLTLNL